MGRSIVAAPSESVDRSAAATLRAARRGLRWQAVALLAPAVLLLLLLLAVPLAYLFRASFNRFDPIFIMQPAFVLDNDRRFFSDGSTLGVLWSTLAYGVEVTGITLLLAFPVARWITRPSRRLRQLWLGLVILHFTLNTAVLSFGWIVILGETGFINTFLLAVHLIDQPVRMIFTPAAVVVALVQALMPFQVLSLLAAFGRIDRSLEEAAASLGAGRFTVLRRVVFPLAVPGVLAGCTFTFLATVTAFVTPRIIGGGRIRMIGSVVYEQIFQNNNWPFAAAVSFILMAITLAAFLITRRLAGQEYLTRQQAFG